MTNVVRAGPLNVFTTLYAYKSADQTNTNGTTFVNDNTLSVTVLAGKIYVIESYLFVGGSDYKIDLNGGSATATNYVATAQLASTNSGGLVAEAGPGVPVALSTALRSSVAQQDPIVLRIMGSVEVNAGGTLIYRFASSTAGNMTMKRGSFLRLTQVN